MELARTRRVCWSVTSSKPMTKVRVLPGPCGFEAEITAQAGEDEVEISVRSGCTAVTGMMEAVGSTFDPYELCLTRPGTGPLYEYASGHFPVHCGCPVIAAITKCAEAECGLACKRTSPSAL